MPGWSFLNLVFSKYSGLRQGLCLDFPSYLKNAGTLRCMLEEVGILSRIAVAGIPIFEISGFLLRANSDSYFLLTYDNRYF